MRSLRLALLSSVLVIGSWSSVFAIDFATDSGFNVSEALKTYAPTSNAITSPNSDMKIEAGGKEKVLEILGRITRVGAYLAIAGIVFSGYKMVTSGGSDEGVKIGKKGVIWSAVGFGAMILAPTLVNLVINTVYSIF